MRLGLLPHLAILLACVAGTVGCASTQPINRKYSAQLAQLAPGTTLEEFHQILPDAVIAGQNTVDGQRVDAYEITHKYMYDQWYGFTQDERLWFYFHSGQLVKWGPPGSWPEKADLVIETRAR